MKKIISVILVVVILAVLGYFAYNFLMKSQAASNAEQAGQQQSQAVPVDALVLRKQSVPLYEELPGRTRAFKVAEIRPQVSGIITERLFTEGAYVEEGQQLYQIDEAPYKALYDSAQADLQKAQANVKSLQSRADRYADLVKIDAISRQEYDDSVASLAQAQADVAVAQAAIVTAEVSLNYTKVYAPISGFISKSFVTQGALVTENQAQELATITQLDPIYVDMTQSSEELMRTKQKMSDANSQVPVHLTYNDGAMKYDEKGVLQFSEVRVDESTSSVELRALFPNPDNILMPGLFVRGTLELDPVDGFLVPHRAAIRQPDGSLIVWRIKDDNTIEQTPIKAQETYNTNQWLVTEGLQDGMKIVTAGFQKIAPGAKVDPAFPENNDEE